MTPAEAVDAIAPATRGALAELLLTMADDEFVSAPDRPTVAFERQRVLRREHGERCRCSRLD